MRRKGRLLMIYDTIRTKVIKRVQQQLEERAIQAGRQMRLAAIQVLRKRGRSAPGQSPGRRTGQLARSWKPVHRIEQKGNNFTVNLSITTDVFYARFLEEGTAKMDKRPFLEKIKKHAWPKVKQIYTNRRYLE